jgi:hypothetical protein
MLLLFEMLMDLAETAYYFCWTQPWGASHSRSRVQILTHLRMDTNGSDIARVKQE